MNPLENKAEEKFCVLKNKRLKWYSDGPRMMEMEGIIDFDIVKCLVMIEENRLDTNEQNLTTESSNVQTEAAEGRSVSQDTQLDEKLYPTKFRVEVEECQTIFIFEAPNYIVL